MKKRESIIKAALDKKWSFETNGHIASSPAIANETVYIGSDDSNVYALVVSCLN